MKKRWMASLAFAATLAGSDLAAQVDGIVAFPGTYSVQLENAWVRIVRVRLAGNANLGLHTHPAGFMFHVYLNDADPIWFYHDGVPGEIMRPTVAARSYRIGLATPETHGVSNPSSRLSDYLRVEYKTRGNESTRRRVPAGTLGTETSVSVEHTGQQSRVTRVTIAPGASQEFVAADAQPALLLFVTDATIGDGGQGRPVSAGADRFVDAGVRVTIRNAGPAPLQLLRFDFLTPPG